MTDNFQPYVGPRPFEQQDQNLFFGRERETRNLKSIITAHQAALLYAQSGAGKTSLLNAGLIPALLEEKYEVLPLARVRGVIPANILPERISNIFVFHTLMSWIKEEEKVDTQMTLASFLKKRKHLIDTEGMSSFRVIIFDQFEELFTSYPERWEKREAFFYQVSEALEEDRLLRALFVIREDYIARLDPHVKHLPEQLRVRYRLERLRLDAATSAIEGPLQDTGRIFDKGVPLRLAEQLRNIRFKSDTGEVIKTMGEYVEPVQLQIVCQNLWQNLPPNITVITSEHLQEFGDVEVALKNYYEIAIEKASKESGVKIEDLRKWFNEKLITPAGTRGTVYRDQWDTGGIANSAVNVLEDQHIIRAEMRAGARWYELTHDQLIEPIHSSNEVWLQHEREEEQKRHIEKERQQARINEQKKIALRLRILVVALTFLFMLASFALGFAIIQRNRAEIQARISFARELAIAADNNLDFDPERSLLLALFAAHVTYSADKTIINEAEDALHRALQASRIQVTLSENISAIYSVAFSPDGVLLATANENGTVKLWNSYSGIQLNTLSGHSNTVSELVFSPGGKHLATASWDGTAKVWNISSHQPITNFPKHSSGIFSLAFSPDGKRLATAHGDGTVHVWDISSSKQLITLSKHTKKVNSVAFSPDGKYLATASDDGTVNIWQFPSGRIILSLAKQSNRVLKAVFSPDGTRLATANEDGTVEVWDVSSGKSLINLNGHTSIAYDVAFSPDGSRLATASEDETAKIWGLNSGQKLLTLNGHTGSVHGVAFSPDGKRLATASWDMTAKVWDISPGRELLTLTSHSDWVYDISFNFSGTHLASASGDSTVKVWELFSDKQPLTLTGHKGPVYSVTFSPDGTRLASASGDSTVKVWEPFSDKQPLTLTGHKGSVYSVTFGPDGTRLASASGDSTVKIWDLLSHKQPLTLKAHEGPVYKVVISSDGTRMATASGDGSAKVWLLPSGGPLLTLSKHNSAVFSVAFNSHRTLLATASGDAMVIIWDLSSGHQILTLSGHTSSVCDVAFSSDEARLFTVSGDRTTKVWNLPSGQEILSLSGHTNAIKGVALTHKGNHLATAGMDRTIRMYTLDAKELIGLARGRVTRSMSDEECRKYLHSKEAQCPAAVEALRNFIKASNYAKDGNIEDAIVNFRNALELDPSLDFDIEFKARQLADEYSQKTRLISDND